MLPDITSTVKEEFVAETLDVQASVNEEFIHRDKVFYNVHIKSWIVICHICIAYIQYIYATICNTVVYSSYIKEQIHM